MGRELIQFIGAGAQKAGTTALNAYLKKHPQVEIPKKKELHFFDNHTNFHSGHQVKENAIQNYHANFSWKKPLQGEFTPDYMYLPQCVLRIRSYNPDIKWILLLRNPIDRAYSQYNMQIAYNYIEGNPDFSDIIRNEEAYRRNEISKKTLKRPLQRFTYLDRGRYSQQIRHIYSYFPEHQVLVLDSSDLFSRPREALDKITDFLCVDKFETIESLEKNKGKYPMPPISDADKEYLKDYFVYEIAELERLTNMSFKHWLG